MAKVTLPKDIAEGIKKLGEAVDIPVKSLLARLGEIVKTDENIQTMEKDNFKIRYAWALLYREHSMTGKAEEFYVMPIAHSRPREVPIKGEKTYVGDLTALVQKIKKGEDGKTELGDVQYGSGTFWRDGAKNAGKVEPGKVYKVALIATENSWGFTISSDRAVFTPVNHEMPDFKKFYEEEIEPKNITITIGEMDLNKKEHETDIKVIEATVIECDIGESASGNEYGRYVVMDDSVIGSNFAIFVDPKDVVWAQGSILRFGGTIDIDDKTSAIRWNNQFILPTDLAMKKEITIKPVTTKQEEVDIDLGGEEAKEEKAEIDITGEEPKKEEKKPAKEEPKEEKDSDEIDYAI